jgi:hypothetical protein
MSENVGLRDELEKDPESFYFAEFESDLDAYVVYFGRSENMFMAVFIAEFQNEEDADEYVDWKNEQLDTSYNRVSDLDNEDEETVADLVDQFVQNDKSWDSD